MVYLLTYTRVVAKLQLDYYPLAIGGKEYSDSPSLCVRPCVRFSMVLFYSTRKMPIVTTFVVHISSVFFDPLVSKTSVSLFFISTSH